jgi:hypothetical protein
MKRSQKNLKTEKKFINPQNNLKNPAKTFIILSKITLKKSKKNPQMKLQKTHKNL